MSEEQHVGMGGKPCRCTPERRAEITCGCAPTYPCHHVPHAECPDAHPCIGECGRMTTAHETNACGYCVHCAADSRWVKIA